MTSSLLETVAEKTPERWAARWCQQFSQLSSLNHIQFHTQLVNPGANAPENINKKRTEFVFE